MSPASLTERISHYVARPDADGFGELATALYTELCERGGRGVEIADWQAIPATGPPETPVDSNAARTLQRDAAERALRGGCLDGLDSPPILELAADPILPAGSLERLGGLGSVAPGAPGGRIDVVAARSWLAARQRDRRAALLLLDVSACQRLLGALERQDLRFQLAFGSRLVLVESPSGAHGFGSLATVPAHRLGLGAEALRGRRSWPGVPTPLYGPLGSDGRLGRATASPWVRVLGPAPGESAGELSILDLTVLDRSFHLATGTAGWVDGQTVTLA